MANIIMLMHELLKACSEQSFKNASLWPPSFLHRTTILTNCKFSEFVKTHLVCPPGKDTDYNKKMSV